MKGFYNLHYFPVWTILLLILWAFSPIGGQAALNSIRLERVLNHSERSLMYFPAPLLNSTAVSDFTSASGLSDGKAIVRLLLGTALSSPSALGLFSNGSSPSFNDTISRFGIAEAVQASQRDAWGSFRVPVIDLLPGYDANNPHEWVTVPSEEIVGYESLVGLPVRGLPSNSVGNMSFIVPTMYTKLEVRVLCGALPLSHANIDLEVLFMDRHRGC